MSERREELLAAGTRYLLANGVADLSLRPMAKKIGTSARLLLFHFHSKEKLLESVLDAVHAELQTSFLHIAEPQSEARQSPMKTFWQWATDKKNLPYLRLLHEVHFIAIQNPTVYAHYLHRSSIDWVDIIQRVLPDQLRNKATATLCAAVFDGLVIELLGTGDFKRTTHALDLFTSMLARENDAPTSRGASTNGRTSQLSDARVTKAKKATRRKTS
jgi:AcrR family transcriptional regulator